MERMKETRLRDLSRALLETGGLVWTGPPARVIAQGGNRYRVLQGRPKDALIEGEAHGAGVPPPGDGLAVLCIEGGRVRWFRLDRKTAVMLAGYH
jgi:hypothetical protein